jgi:hypothetical protein
VLEVAAEAVARQFWRGSVEGKIQARVVRWGLMAETTRVGRSSLALAADLRVAPPVT